MPLAEFLKDPRPPATAKPDAPPMDPAAKLRRQDFLEFGSIVFLGLLLAGWYVAFRVVAGGPGARPSVPAVAPVPSSHGVISPVVPKAPIAGTRASIPIHDSNGVAGSVAVKAPLANVPGSVLSHESDKVVGPVAPKTPIAESHSSVPSIVPHKDETALVKAITAPAKPKGTVSRPFERRDANPHAGERYLQIAAFGPRALDGFLKTLEGQGLHPVVAPGPVDNIYRILIGPFPNSAALEETRRLIQAQGIEPILRSY